MTDGAPPRGTGRPRLLQIFPGESRGGVERYCLAVAAAAVKHGWNAHAAFPPRGATQDLRDDYARSGVATHRLEIPDLRFRTARTLRELLPPLARTAALLARLRPDVVHVNLPWPDHGAGVVRACSLLGVPAVVVFHLVPEGFPVDAFRVGHIAGARRTRQRWVTVSRAARDIVSGWFGVERGEIAVVPNGVPLPGRVPDTAERAAAHRAVCGDFGWPPDTALLLTTARLAPQKGFDDLLAAAPDVLARHPGARFLWAGGGDVNGHRESVRGAGLEGKVVPAGHRTDVDRLLAAADLFVLPTRFEGLPFALLEAMAAGVPVVSTTANGVTEVVTHEEHGLLAAAGDPRALAAMLNRALDDPAAMRAAAGRARVRVEEFGEERMLAATLALLGDAAAGRGKGGR